MSAFAPKVSIVIPVYNGSNYLRDAIDSALAQTYPDIEVLVVNDGSSDGGATEAIALSYGDRIRYLAKANGGVATALNAGIAAMTGDYFSWLSHDDVYHPEKVRRQIDAIRDLAPETIAYSDYELIDKRSKSIGKLVFNTIYAEAKLNIPLFPLLRGLINGCTLLIHKSNFEKFGLFDPAYRTTQDYMLWFDMFRGSPIVYINELLVQSRIHANQGSRSIKNHLTECNDLWISMISRVTDQEMRQLFGNPYAFYHTTEIFLRTRTHFLAAADKSKALSRLAEPELLDTISRTTVSVIIPFFNRIPLLLEAMDSVLQQTHPHVDIVLVDDGSTDDLSALRSKRLENGNIRYVRQDRAGPAAARNRGLQEATGDYIAFLDSDDLFMKDKIAKQLDFMLRNGYDFSHTSYMRVANGGTEREVVASGKFSGNVFPLTISGSPIATPTVMLRRDAVKAPPFPEEIGLGEDACAWIVLSQKHELGGYDAPLTQVRVLNTACVSDRKKLQAGIFNIMNFVMSKPEYNKHQDELYKLSCQFMDTFEPSRYDKIVRAVGYAKKMLRWARLL